MQLFKIAPVVLVVWLLVGVISLVYELPKSWLRAFASLAFGVVLLTYWLVLLGSQSPAVLLRF